MINYVIFTILRLFISNPLQKHLNNFEIIHTNGFHTRIRIMTF